MLQAIVAVYSDWGIGVKGTQPIVLSADRAHFRELTSGSAILFGRKTMEDFPEKKPLPGRFNILISTQSIQIDNGVCVHSVEEALKECEKCPKAFVIGGSQVYSEFLPHISRIFVTKIDLHPHSDSFFADLDANTQWNIIQESDWMWENGVPYRFLVYERSKA